MGYSHGSGFPWTAPCLVSMVRHRDNPLRILCIESPERRSTSSGLVQVNNNYILKRVLNFEPNEYVVNEYSLLLLQIHDIYHPLPDWCHRGAPLFLLGPKLCPRNKVMEHWDAKLVELYILIFLLLVDRDDRIHSHFSTSLLAYVRTTEKDFRWR